MAVTEKDTPHLYLLLRRSMADAGYSTYKAKNHYQRARPFMVNHKPVCTPEEEVMLRGDGSYPSGHSAIGWAWALILSEVAPEKADAILYRGRAYSQSRVVCNVHWQSDINEGRMMGAAIVPLLHNNAAFEKDLERAKIEYRDAIKNGSKPARDCDTEKEALRLYSVVMQ